MKKTLLVLGLLAITSTSAHADALTITDAKQLTPEQAEKKVCRDVGDLKFAVEVANNILERPEIAAPTGNGFYLLRNGAARGVYMGQLMQANRAANVVKADRDAFQTVFDRLPTCPDVVIPDLLRAI